MLNSLKKRKGCLAYIKDYIQRLKESLFHESEPLLDPPKCPVDERQEVNSDLLLANVERIAVLIQRLELRARELRLNHIRESDCWENIYQFINWLVKANAGIFILKSIESGADNALLEILCHNTCLSDDEWSSIGHFLNGIDDSVLNRLIRCTLALEAQFNNPTACLATKRFCDRYQVEYLYCFKASHENVYFIVCFQRAVYQTIPQPLVEALTRLVGLNLSEIYIQSQIQQNNLKMIQQEKQNRVAIQEIRHDMNTSLSSIQSLTTLMYQSERRNEKEIYHSQVLGAIELTSMTLQQLSWKNMDRTERAVDIRMNREWFDPLDMICKLAGMFSTKAAQKGINLNVVFLGAMPSEFFFHKLSLFNILLNLISNAIKYTYRGSVTLTVSCAFRQGEHHMKFKVRDTGIGIASDKLDVIFEYGERTTGAAKLESGQGIGLHICQQTAQMAGSDIQVVSSTDYKAGVAPGSEFSFMIQGGATLQESEVKGVRLWVLSDTYQKEFAFSVVCFQTQGVWPDTPNFSSHYLLYIDDARDFESLFALLLKATKNQMNRLILLYKDGIDGQLVLDNLRINHSGVYTQHIHSFNPLSRFELSNLLRHTNISKVPVAEKPIKVLIVDDMPEVLAMWQQLFDSVGYEVHYCQSGKEAVNMLLSQHFDIAFVDYDLGCTTGDKVIAEVKALDIDLPMIVASADESQEKRKICKEAGAFNFIRKPLTQATALTQIKEAFPDRVYRNRYSMSHSMLIEAGNETILPQEESEMTLELLDYKKLEDKNKRRILRDITCRMLFSKTDPSEVVVRRKKMDTAFTEQDAGAYKAMLHIIKNMAEILYAQKLQAHLLTEYSAIAEQVDKKMPVRLSDYADYHAELMSIYDATMDAFAEWAKK